MVNEGIKNWTLDLKSRSPVQVTPYHHQYCSEIYQISKLVLIFKKVNILKVHLI